jgi:hypothetical protein
MSVMGLVLLLATRGRLGLRPRHDHR